VDAKALRCKGLSANTTHPIYHVHADVSVPTPPYGAVDTSRETPCFCRFVTGWGLHGFFARLLLGFFDCGIFAFLFLLSIVDQLAVGLS
jgi:hypothetical protein